MGPMGATKTKTKTKLIGLRPIHWLTRVFILFLPDICSIF
jgi:hypothetical protein